ncbi:helix-turn-helix transcriptional regulator [Microbacterium capsulatum]|uniref:Helix-turn-helix transcriptional regulator n=1 Tax=Microbacterium capsulatum TaxID=3041921 RepID=A0ABU0XFB3_9MICO|nr:helix-turn-helix transcriptional regulator [Microbacterium sp. ASV81]MDQ4213741.1 helix-turn-helix transcriptional regulator [Microbacterium sp. ASV81]
MRREQAEREAWAVFARELADRLVDARTQHGLTQAELAERAQISLYSVQTYENGYTAKGNAVNPTLMTILAITQALEVGLDELLPTPPALMTHP